MVRRKILIIGSSGFIGSHVFNRLELNPEWQVIPDHDSNGRRFDLARAGEVESFIRSTQADVVIHTAAMPSIAACASHPNLATRVNTEAVVEIADVCAQISSRLIHLSTDQVFDGNSAPYAESAGVCPLHHYGLTKSEADQALKQHQVESVILRPTLVYGNDPSHVRSASESIRAAIHSGETLNLFDDEIRVPLFVGDLVDAIAHFASTKDEGLFHVGGPTRLSRLEFGHEVCHALGLDPKGIQATSLQSCNLIGKRPRDLTLDSTKLAAAMCWKPKTPRKALA